MDGSQAGQVGRVIAAARDPSAALRLLFDPGGGRGGRAEVLDAGYRTVASAGFGEILDAVPCFAKGTLIATERGERCVETLGPGDRIATRDHGLRPVVWVGAERFGWRELGALPVLRPVRLGRGALGDGIPVRDLVVSPNHRLTIATAEGGERRVRAADLLGRPGVAVIGADEVTYCHIVMPRHEMVLANGAWSESFPATDAAIAALSAGNRAALRRAIVAASGSSADQPALPVVPPAVAV